MNPPPTPPRRNAGPGPGTRFFVGCGTSILLKVVVIIIAICTADCRLEERRKEREAEKARLEAERAETTRTAARLADEFAKETDADGRYVRKAEGLLPDADFWGRQLRLEYHPGTLSDGLTVRSAGPDGVWNNADDVTADRTSRLRTRAVARDAAGGLLDAARTRLLGKPKADDKPAGKKAGGGDF